MKKITILNKFGSCAETARALTAAGYPISGAAVVQWGAVVPELPARQLHEITRGKLKFVPASYKRQPK